MNWVEWPHTVPRLGFARKPLVRQRSPLAAGGRLSGGSPEYPDPDAPIGMARMGKESVAVTDVRDDGCGDGEPLPPAQEAA